MGRTALFVHGTGVRADRFTTLFRQIEQGLDGRQLDVQPCYWGGHCGAELGAGRSIPSYKPHAEVTSGDESAWQDANRWSMLDIDALYELRVLGTRAEVVDLQPGHPGRAVRQDIQLLDPSPSLEVLLEEAGWTTVWERSKAELLGAQELDRALSLAGRGAIPERQAAARALTAVAQRGASADGSPFPPPELRDAVAAELIRLLGADVAGWATDLVARAATLVVGGTVLSMAPTVTWAAARQRGAVADATAPFAGDVLLYQARGEPIRQYIRNQISDIGRPVVLLAHSLGGVACVDMLFEKPMREVELLVTVGSQAAFLHELGALWSLDPGDAVPPHFETPWLNVYDQKDLLSFVAGGVFGDVVIDVEVDNKCSFPRSHSQYFSNPQFWATLEERGL